MTPPDDGRDVRWAKALAHPLRVQILEHLVATPVASPTDLAAPLGIERGLVSYHMRRLLGLGIVSLVSRTKVRGAVQHHYRLTDREATILALEHADELARIATTGRPQTTVTAARWLTALGAAFRTSRNEQGIPIPDLARRAGTAPKTLGRIERGEADPQMTTLHRLADALGLTLGDVLRKLR